MKNNRKGFTTVELVIVIAVIAILAAVLIPTFSNLVDKANKSAALQQARSVYSHYVIDKAGEAKTNGVFVKVTQAKKDYIFKVENGQMVTEPCESSAVGDNSVYITSATGDVGYECARGHSALTTGTECTCGYKKTT